MDSGYRRPLLILAGMGVWLAVIVAVASQIWAAQDQTNGFRFANDRAELEAWLGSPLPTEAAAVQFDSRSLPNFLIWVRFEIAPGPALEAFLTGLSLGELRQGSNPFIPADSRPPDWWWTPDASAAYAGSSFQPVDITPPYRVIGALAEQTTPDLWAVYLRVEENG